MNNGHGGDEIELSHGDLSVRVSRRGAAVVAATFRNIPFLVPAGGLDGTFANFPMVPFGNRVDGNAMSFAGRDYIFQPNTAEPLYRHGDGWLGLPNGHHLPELGGLIPLSPGEVLSGKVTIELSALPVQPEGR